MRVIVCDHVICVSVREWSHNNRRDDRGGVVITTRGVTERGGAIITEGVTEIERVVIAEG